MGHDGTTLKFAPVPPEVGDAGTVSSAFCLPDQTIPLFNDRNIVDFFVIISLTILGILILLLLFDSFKKRYDKNKKDDDGGKGGNGGGQGGQNTGSMPSKPQRADTPDPDREGKGKEVGCGEIA